MASRALTQRFINTWLNCVGLTSAAPTDSATTYLISIDFGSVSFKMPITSRNTRLRSTWTRSPSTPLAKESTCFTSWPPRSMTSSIVSSVSCALGSEAFERSKKVEIESGERMLLRSCAMPLVSAPRDSSRWDRDVKRTGLGARHRLQQCAHRAVDQAPKQRVDRGRSQSYSDERQQRRRLRETRDDGRNVVQAFGHPRHAV